MSSDGIDVTLGTLQYQESFWNKQSNNMAEVASQSRGTECNKYAGIFSDAADAYNKACELIATLCQGGQVEMDRIARALLDSHRTYTAAEQQIIAHINQVLQCS